MELRVLGYFLAIAREENFTRAAEQLHVTQPTLSRQIADLETELGVKLFTRSNHSIVLTEDGMLLKRRAQEILSLADKTKRDFLYKEKSLEGMVTIGSGEFLSTGILTDCIAEFRKNIRSSDMKFTAATPKTSGTALNVGFWISVLCLSSLISANTNLFPCRSKNNGTLLCGRIPLLPKRNPLDQRLLPGCRLFLP